MYNCRKGDYEAMNNYLGSINWSEILSENVHDDWQVFKTTVQNTIFQLLFLKVAKLLLGGLKISWPNIFQLLFLKVAKLLLGGLKISPMLLKLSNYLLLSTNIPNHVPGMQLSVMLLNVRYDLLENLMNSHC